VIVNFAINPAKGWLADSGSLIHLSAAEMEARGPSAVMQHLVAFENRTYIRGEYSDMSISEKLHFDHAHDDIHLTLRPDGSIELQPMVPIFGKSGSTGEKGRSIVIAPPVTAPKLWSGIKLALSRCRE
jgi:hypothetical protein